MCVSTWTGKHQAYRRLSVGSRRRGLENLRLKCPAAASHGAFDGDGDERRGIFLEGVAAENDKIGELARFDGTFQIFFIRGVGAVDGADADRFFNRNFLLGSPNIALRVR